MCLVAFAINASARWPLVIASNRDESYKRPTLPLQSWESRSGQTIISGRDLNAGGTWLGINLDGRVAFLTNVREPPLARKPAPKSRGELVTRWLEDSHTATEFMCRIDPAEYGGFNLVLGDWRGNAWTWLGNRHQCCSSADTARGAWIYRDLADGIYGLSNAALDTPWPKTLALKAALNQALQSAEHEKSTARLEGQLWHALASRQEADSGSLPHTGVPPDWEQLLSSAFVYSPERAYGTRCSTLLIAETSSDAARQQMRLRIQEKTFPFNYETIPPEQANSQLPIASQALLWTV